MTLFTLQATLKLTAAFIAYGPDDTAYACIWIGNLITNLI